MLLISVHFFDRVVDIHQGIVVDSRHDRGVRGDADKPSPGDGVQLPDVTKRERPQERPQRRRGIRPDEEFLHTAVPQQSHVINRISTSEHPRNQRGHFQPGVRTEVPRQCQPRIREVAEPSFHRQRHRGDQPRGRHEICVVEGG
ncbi:hypothetical protein ADICYQ_1158 [Cyclobacterium qasimii M12-11B]|uniref:Uncharacterized protein n=1 Tax=Cyclobacterium qasimii M12-11B TaxID=641524 RepID=S7VIV4_9BACT|nr:hypothetical protein ADICYQ_1158 [Cyclobacterium qasimii M12-11B]